MINRNETSNLQSSTIWMPTSVESAVEQMSQLRNEARYITGGTLLQIQWENGHRIPNHLISLELIPSLKEVELNEKEHFLAIGASTALARCRNHPIIKMAHPIIGEAVQSIAAPGVRSRGTIGGNIMGRVGDLIPLLLAMEAKLLIIHEFGEEKMDMWQWLKQGENYEHALLKQVVLAMDFVDNDIFFKKIGRRESFTAAIVTIAGKIVKTELGLVADIRLAAGGGDNEPILLEQTEALLKGKRTEEIDWRAVYASICNEFMPVSDAFVTADYRKKVAANLIIAELKSRLSQMGRGDIK